jgi:hypothetical protein
MMCDQAHHLGMKPHNLIDKCKMYTEIKKPMRIRYFFLSNK